MSTDVMPELIGSRRGPAMDRTGPIQAWAEQQVQRLAARRRPEAAKPTKAEDMQAGIVREVLARERPGRNEPCPCGSGAKFKKCCLRGRA